MITETGRLGPFVLEEKLGDEDSTLFRAVHLREQRALAVRLLPDEIAPGKTAETAFARQVGALKSLQHPHVVCCYGGGRHHKQAYLVFELVHGESLAALLARHAPVPWQTVVDCGWQICSALEYLQQRGIVHRRLTPERLLITEEGHVQLSGLGLAQVSNGAYPLTDEPTPETAAYMAPESFGVSASFTHRGDLYALGCILFEMLTGRPPFVGDTVAEIQRQHQDMPPPRVSAFVLDCPIWLENLVAHLLEKDPARRPPFASAVAVALEETRAKVAENAGLVAHALSGNASMLRSGAIENDARKLFGRKKRKARPRGPIYERAWFLAACITMLLGGAAWALWPHGEEELFRRGDALMASGDRSQWQEARIRYFEPLLAKFPDGEYAPRVREHLDTMEMEQAEARLMMNTRLGREPTSEGERLFADAWRYEQFGDRLTALEKYQGLVHLLSDEGPDRPYVRLARRQVERLTHADTGESSRGELLHEKLRLADDLAARGDTLAAHQIWLSVVALYQGNKELRTLVKHAQSRLDGQSARSLPPHLPDADDPAGEEFASEGSPTMVTPATQGEEPVAAE
jgi:hypothetical protein